MLTDMFFIVTMHSVLLLLPFERSSETLNDVLEVIQLA
jgi:hypothetical protein